MPSSPLKNLLRLPLRCVPELMPLPILTGRLAGKKWLSTSATHGCWLGTYERELQRLLAEHLKPSTVFYDVGANVGFFSLLGSTLAREVHAFEPLPRNVGLLRRNLELNHVRNVKVWDVAVSDSLGKGHLSTGNAHEQGALGSEGIEVECVTLDAMVSSGRAVPPGVIKMDVEGAESMALDGARQTLLAHRPVVLLSTHGFRQHEACWAALSALGYSLRLRRDGAQDGQYEVVATG